MKPLLYICLALLPLTSMANPVLDSLSPSLFSNPVPRVDRALTPSKVAGLTISQSRSSNQNLGTDATTFRAASLGFLTVPVDSSFKSVDGGSTQLNAWGQFSSEKWAVSGMISRNDSRVLGITDSAAISLNTLIKRERLLFKPLAALYYSSTPDKVDTRAYLFGGVLTAQNDRQLTPFAETYVTQFQSDDKIFLDESFSYDTKIGVSAKMSEKVSASVGGVIQHYDTLTDYAAFDAQGVWGSLSFRYRIFDSVALVERKTLNYKAPNPLTAELLDRTRYRVGLKLNAKTSFGTFAIEHLNDRFSSNDPLKPANRAQFRISWSSVFAS